jgi:thiosulfate/3-mercaptopyruvate sulfurtransferase
MPFDSPFVSAAWLAAHRSDVVVVDTRWYLDGRSGRAAYDAGHIAGAVFADLDVDLSALPGPGGRHPLPDPEAFADAMGRLGISDDSHVVTYDDAGAMVAGRLWWMLDALGVNAAILDGGLHAWSRPLSTESARPAQATFTSQSWPTERFVSASDVATREDEVVVLDARSAERFAGMENAIDARFGHIPGARSAPFSAVLDDRGRAADTQSLADHFRSLGVGPDTEVIAYCGSGVSACADLAALRAIGNTSARLYAGSWSEWGGDESRPIETGPD